MFCAQCGNLLPEVSVSCPVCGHRRGSTPITDPYMDSSATIPKNNAKENSSSMFPDIGMTETSSSALPDIEITETSSSVLPDIEITETSSSALPDIEITGDSSSITPRIAELENTSLVLEPIYEPVIKHNAKASVGIPSQPYRIYSKYIVITLAKIVLSVILGIFVFVFILAFVTLLATHPESAAEVIENADIRWLLEETGIDSVIINELNGSGIIGTKVDTAVISEFLKRKNVSVEIGKVAGTFARAIADGNYGYYLNSRDIANFVKAVTPDIREQFGLSLIDADYDIITNSLNNYVNLSDYSIGNLFDNIGMGNTVLYVLLSVYPLIVSGLLGVLVIFDIFLLHRKRIRAAFLSAGIPVALSGFTCFVAGLLIGPYSGLLRNSDYYGIIKMIVGLANIFLLPGLICLTVGILSVAVYVFIYKKQEKQMLTLGSGQSTSKVWRITGLVTNASILFICSAFSLLFFLNMP